MLHTIPNLLSVEQLNRIDGYLSKVVWEDGKDTAHGSAKDRKQNSQSLKQSDAMDEINRIIHGAIQSNSIIQSLVMPVEILYPMLNKHGAGDFYGKHIDRPIRLLPKRAKYVRCDVSITAFLSDISSYEGGELAIYDGDAKHKVKLPRGYAVVYPSGFVHEVCEVTEGERICSVTWMQSAISDVGKRELLFDVSKLSNLLSQKIDDPDLHVLVSKIKNNLTREYCEF